MEHTDILWFISGLFGCWVTGYLAGWLFTFIKKLLEHV